MRVSMLFGSFLLILIRAKVSELIGKRFRGTLNAVSYSFADTFRFLSVIAHANRVLGSLCYVIQTVAGDVCLGATGRIRDWGGTQHKACQYRGHELPTADHCKTS